MTYGVPDYKLRYRVIERRVKLLEEEGITFRYGVNAGVDISWSDLRSQFDAVVLCIGAEAPRDVKVEGRELDGVHYAMEFLPQANRYANGDDNLAALHPEGKRIDPRGKNVLVIGGGDTASDCIGNCLRMGATKVANINYHDQKGGNRPEGNPWPQWADLQYWSSSHHEMLALGGQMVFSHNTNRFVGKDGKVTGLELVQVDWSQGRPPKPVPGSSKTYEC